MPGPWKTVVSKDAPALARSVAERLVELSRTPGSAPIAIALSGGSTPKRLYETLASPQFIQDVHWDRLEFFFGDERSVAPSDPDSNYGMAERALLSHIRSKAYRMRAEIGDAESYQRLLEEHVAAKRDGVPVLDLVLLGLGTDGHTASLFPGTKALHETRRLVVMNEVAQLKTRRMTFTYPLINAARRVWILVSGADKHEIVSRCIAAHEGASIDRRWPILGVRPEQGELVWWIDEAAAGGREKR